MNRPKNRKILSEQQEPKTSRTYQEREAWGNQILRADIEKLERDLAAQPSSAQQWSLLQGKLYSIVERHDGWSQPASRDVTDQALNFVMSRLVELWKSKGVCTTFGYSKKYLNLFIDHLDDVADKIRYIAKAHLLAASEVRAPAGIATWLKLKLTMVKLEEQAIEPETEVKSADHSHVPTRTRGRRNKGVNKIRWAGEKVALTFWMSQLWNAEMISKETYDNRFNILVAHFCDEDGRDLNIDSLRELERRYEKNKVFRDANGVGMPRDGEKIQAMIQAMQTVSKLFPESS